VHFSDKDPWKTYRIALRRAERPRLLPPVHYSKHGKRALAALRIGRPTNAARARRGVRMQIRGENIASLCGARRNGSRRGLRLIISPKTRGWLPRQEIRSAGPPATEARLVTRALTREPSWPLCVATATNERAQA